MMSENIRSRNIESQKESRAKIFHRRVNNWILGNLHIQKDNRLTTYHKKAWENGPPPSFRWQEWKDRYINMKDFRLF